MRDGWQDGSRASMADWQSHLSQIFTDVRLRETIELRAADGPPAAAIASVPAFWTGILYDRASRDQAWQLMEPFSLAQLRAAHRDAARLGLQARLGGDPLLGLAQEIVRLARQGQVNRIDSGIEPARVASYLDPIERVVATGQTFAEQCLGRWYDEFRESPASYVNAFRLV